MGDFIAVREGVGDQSPLSYENAIAPLEPAKRKHVEFSDFL